MTALKHSTPSFSPPKNPKNNYKNLTVNSNEKNNNKDVKLKGHIEEKARRTRSINDITGIPLLNLDENANYPETEGWNLRNGGKNVLVMETIVEDEILSDLLQFTTEEITPEVDFWNNSVYCYILGDNPPIEFIEGYVYRVWGKFGIDRVSFPNNGLVGKIDQLDKATEEKVRLSHARVMVEVEVDHFLLDKVRFLDKNGKLVVVDVEYEWKPISCPCCKGFGHYGSQCRKVADKRDSMKGIAPKAREVTKKIWRPKQVEHKEEVATPIMLNPGVQELRKVGRILQILDKMHSIGFWNVRGLNNLNKQKYLPTADGMHKEGRIWIFWNPKCFEVQFLYYNAQYIPMLV
ncbi:hypothetical protein KSS87_009496 [Heliosperma pusillum]|nr:hypothetical protein KSS87_009496 [Heliosperma pusillum]